MSARRWPPLALASILAAMTVLACGGASPVPDEPTAPPAATPASTPATPARTPTATPTTAASTPVPATPVPTAAETVAAEPPAIALVPAFPGLPEPERPVAMLEAPGRDLFLIALQDGRVLALPRDGPWGNPRTVHDQRERTSRDGNEQGLLSIALDPDFARNGYVYAWYSVRGGADVTRLARFTATGEGASFAFDASSELTILEIEQPYPNHNGGTILFGPDDMLSLGVGDGGAGGDPHGHGQNPGTLLGTVVRIDVRGATADAPYAIPPDNPFRDREDARPEVWAWGLRNPWRMSFDRETGILWAGDVGQDAVEEIVIVRAGENHGWNVVEGTRCFSPREGCDRTGLAPPVHEYGRDGGCSVTGGYVYRGAAMPALRGWYLFSDFCAGGIRAIPAGSAASGEATQAVALWEDGPGEIASFAEDAAGELYVISFGGQRIYRIVATEGP